MINAFLKFLGGEPGEEKPMLLLLAKGFFMGIFLASFQIGAEESFVKSVIGMDQEVKDTYVTYSIFVTGFFGIIATSLFVYLQKIMKFSTLVVSSVFLITIVILLFRLFYDKLTYIIILDDLPLLPFLLFSLIGPITAITILGFWGIFGRIFNLKQSKRIIGGIDTGQLTATIIAFFSIPFLTSLNILNDNDDLLAMATIACFGMFLLTIVIIRNYNLDKAMKLANGQQRQTVSYKDIFTNPYMRMMSLFIVFSMGASVFMQYTFISSTTTMYQANEDEVRNFLSFFNGAIMIVSFFIQSFVNDKIINDYGLRVALMIMPLVLILFIGAAIIAGHIYGYEEKTENYIYFFLFTSVGKLFTASLKDALENPAFKMFFLPLDLKIRFDVQTRIEGVISEAARLIAGAIQIGLAALVFIEVIHFSYFVVLLSAIVIYFAHKLFQQYKVTLRNTLEIQKASFKDQSVRNEINIINALKAETLSNSPDEVINALKILEKVDPIQLEPALITSLQSERKKVRHYAYRRLNELLCYDKLDELKEEVKYEDDPKLLELSTKVLANLQKAEEYELKFSAIKGLSKSTEAEDRVLGARLLSKLTQDRFVPILMNLCKDINPEVRIAALVSAGKLRRPEFWPVFIENLHLATYGNIAKAALVEAGEAAFPLIDTAFYKTNQHQITMLRIIQIIGQVGGYRAAELLWKKIDYPNKQIVSEILQTLSYLGFIAREFQAARIKLFIDNIIRNITWNLKALEEIPREDRLDRLVRSAIEEENIQNYNDIFMLLSMIYDPQSIQLIKENVELDTTDSVAFAIEMLDLFVDEEIKPTLFAVLDDTKVEDKLAKLHLHYAPESFDNQSDLLLQILNRDYNFINRWTKVVSVYRLGTLEENEVAMSLIANIFNPDKFILETVFNSIYQIDPEAYYTHSKRISPILKAEIDRAIIPPTYNTEGDIFYQRKLLLERVLFLRDSPFFEQLNGLILMTIAENSDEILLDANVPLIEDGDSGSTPIYLILDGEVEITHKDGSKQSVTKGDVIGEKIILDTSKFDFTAATVKKTLLLMIRKEEFFDALTIYKDLIFAQLNIMSGKVRKERTEEEVDFSLFD
ncbi:MAG: cyclic nucleotide-binding domain-containing protein [Cyclobacteriaceae bacterium]